MRANQGGMLRTIYIGSSGRMWMHRASHHTRKVHPNTKQLYQV